MRKMIKGVLENVLDVPALRARVHQLEILLAAARGRNRDLERKLDAARTQRIIAAPGTSSIPMPVEEKPGVHLRGYDGKGNTIFDIDTYPYFRASVRGGIVEPGSFVDRILQAEVMAIVHAFDGHLLTEQVRASIEQRVRVMLHQFGQRGFSPVLARCPPPTCTWTHESRAYVILDIHGKMAPVILGDRRVDEQGGATWWCTGLDGRSYGSIQEMNIHVFATADGVPERREAKRA